jgi:1,4-alpha-glucan branching enzyme
VRLEIATQGHSAYLCGPALPRSVRSLALRDDHLARMDWTTHEMHIGADLIDGGTSFRVWAPQSEAVDVVVLETFGDLRSPADLPIVATFPLRRETDGYFSALCPGVGPGALYAFRLEHDGVFADPASRFQPVVLSGRQRSSTPPAFIGRMRDGRVSRPRTMSSTSCTSAPLPPRERGSRLPPTCQTWSTWE